MDHAAYTRTYRDDGVGGRDGGTIRDDGRAVRLAYAIGVQLGARSSAALSRRDVAVSCDAPTYLTHEPRDRRALRGSHEWERDRDGGGAVRRVLALARERRSGSVSSRWTAAGKKIAAGRATIQADAQI